MSQKDIDELHGIGAALATERDLDALLGRILEKSRRILSADAGSLFLAEKKKNGAPARLRFKLAQNDSVPVRLEAYSIPINRKSLAGYVAETGEALRFADVYRIPAAMPFRFNDAIDRETGYRSRSLLSVPMIDHRDELIGVVQLWNKKAGGKIVPFTEQDHRLLASLSSQAGIAIENACLYAEIKHLFEGFIKASVTAIEARDPVTSGHSERVAVLTVALARATGVFTEEQIQEIRYAALLHDFGKIGVPESVLTKTKKLGPQELEIVRYKLDLMHRSAELKAARGKNSEKKLSAELKEIAAAWRLIVANNEPALLPGKTSAALRKFSAWKVSRPGAGAVPVLTSEQIGALSVPQGSLSERERREIEAHVTHTYRFLSTIPWTRDLRGVPDIAHAHHEKLDGSGYPRGVSSEDIPLQSKIMAVADIFDALVAGDRPYKKSVPVKTALRILRSEAENGKLDAGLVRLFAEKKIHRLTAPRA